MNRERDRFNAYSGNRRQQNPQELKYERNDDESYYSYRQQDFDRGDRSDDRREGRRSQPEEYRGQRESYNDGYENRYGEHPASRGREEYRGNNKRRTGLGRSESNERSTRAQQSRFQERDEFSRNERREGRREERNEPRHLARREYDDYLNRNQYETPYHGRDIYDPREADDRNEEMRHDRDLGYRYQNQGYQSSGRTDGFGRSSRRQSSQDWMDEDEYRHGHAARRSSSGKFGAR